MTYLYIDVKIYTGVYIYMDIFIYEDSFKCLSMCKCIYSTNNVCLNLSVIQAVTSCVSHVTYVMDFMHLYINTGFVKYM